MPKAKRKVYHVSQKDGGNWTVKAEGAKGVSASFKVKTAAVARAKELAKKVFGVVAVHKADGSAMPRIKFDAPKPAVKKKAKPAAKKRAKPVAKKKAKPVARKKAKPAAKKTTKAAARKKR